MQEHNLKLSQSFCRGIWALNKHILSAAESVVVPWQDTDEVMDSVGETMEVVVSGVVVIGDGGVIGVLVDRGVPGALDDRGILGAMGDSSGVMGAVGDSSGMMGAVSGRRQW